MWTHWICATRTGRKITQVEPSAGRFGRKLNGIGGGQHDFGAGLRVAGETPAQRREARLDLTTTWNRTIVQCWNGQPIYAGLLVGKALQPDGTVSLLSVDLREVLKYRSTFGISGYNGAADEQLKLEKQSLASIAGYLIWDVMQGPTEHWQLPLVLPPRNIAGTQDRTYHEFNLPIIETELSAIQNTKAGPDIEFVPSWTANDTLQWTARVGNLTGETLEWNLTVPKPALTDFSFREDGNKQGNVFYAIGNGSDRDLKVARSSTILGPEDVALERIVRHSQVRDYAILQDRADEELRAHKNPTRQYEFSMQADDIIGLDRLQLGQRLRVYTKDHDWLPDGWLTSRLVGFTGDLTNTIQLQLQEQ